MLSCMYVCICTAIIRALTKLTISGQAGNSTVTIETSMTEADFHGKTLGASGAIMLAAFLPKCQ